VFLSESCDIGGSDTCPCRFVGIKFLLAVVLKLHPGIKFVNRRQSAVCSCRNLLQRTKINPILILNKRQASLKAIINCSPFLNRFTIAKMLTNVNLFIRQQKIGS